uniref:Uncharacterized protein n=1 Tax=Ascaris lumbricoides TaxID=6252 RepID=A0A9J2PZ54_ASCLU
MGSLKSNKYVFSDIVRRKHLSLEYETSLPNLLYVRMREGYTVKEIRFVEKSKEKNETFIVVELRLPWKPLVFIEYKITASWPLGIRREKVKVSLVFEAPYNVMKDLVSERRFTSPQRQCSVDAFRNAIGKDLEAKCSQDASVNRFVEFWRLLCDLDEGIWQKWVHTHTIRMILMHDERAPSSNLFTFGINRGTLSNVTANDALTALHEALSRITTFPLVRGQSYIKLVMGEDITKPPIFFYIIRTSMEAPCIALKIAFLGGISGVIRNKVTFFCLFFIWKLFLEDITKPPIFFYIIRTSMEAPCIALKIAFLGGISGVIRNKVTFFCLFFIWKLFLEDITKPPIFFYIIRTSMEAPCIALKIAFLGGISGVIRNKIVSDIKDAIISLEIDRCSYFTVMREFSDSRDDSAVITRTSRCRAVILLDRPMERILVRYKKIPLAVDRIVRLERGGTSNREMILHNSIAKYLCCRRQIWQMHKAFASAFSLTNASAEFILSTLLQRRLSEGFHIAYGANGVVNLVRQMRAETEGYVGSVVEQYIIFPPSRIRDGHGFDLPKTATVDSCLSGRILPDNSEEFASESYAQKGDADLQLITELWTEPPATTDTGAMQRMAQRYRKVRWCYKWHLFITLIKWTCCYQLLIRATVIMHARSKADVSDF